jgi:hypothetical protein
MWLRPPCNRGAGDDKEAWARARPLRFGASHSFKRLIFGELRQLEHDAEKRMPVFGKDRAQTTSQSEIPTQPKIISF